MTTSIEGRVLRSVGLDSFADITDVPLVVPGGIDRKGLLFDGDLTDEQVGDIWWRMTSVDTGDEESRRNLAAVRDTASAADLATPEGLDALRCALIDAISYRLGDA